MSSDFSPSSRATISASTVSWLWPCTVTSAVTDTAPSGSVVTLAIHTAPVLGTGFFARLRGHQGREITHVRHRRLDDDREADAVFAPCRAGLVAAALERV